MLEYFYWLILIKTGAVAIFSWTHYFFESRAVKKYCFNQIKPKVSVLVPGYNEEQTLDNCIQSLMKQDYPDYEILIIDDGSKDDTARIGMDIARKYREKVRFFHKPNGGKADALNWGIARAKGDIVVCIDADSVFAEDTVSKLAIWFNDPKVAAVAGNVKVSNRDKLLNRFQAMEYISGLNLERRTFALLNSVQVISGAIGAFRKSSLRLIGGYSKETLVEDMDLTISLAKKGMRVQYCGKAISYTEAPESLDNFVKQRTRWMRGGWEVLEKYRYMLFNPKYGMMGLVGLPYFLIYPLFDVAVTTAYGFVLINAIVTGKTHEIFSGFLVMFGLQFVLLFQSLWMDREDMKLLLYSGWDSLVYRPIMSFLTVKTLINHLMKTKTGWNKLPRMGKNMLLPY